MNRAQKQKELKALATAYFECEKCPVLCRNRNMVVFGAGEADADLMIIGEAPGWKEDQEGTPFIGPPGELLNQALTEAGFQRKQIYVTNTVLCRPSTVDEGQDGKIKLKHRELFPVEKEACRPRLLEEIYLVDPKLILLLGKHASELVTRASMKNAVGAMYSFEVPGRIEGNVLEYNAIVTYHPAAILRESTVRTSGSKAEKLFQHIKFACDIIRTGNTIQSGVDHGQETSPVAAA